MTAMQQSDSTKPGMGRGVIDGAFRLLHLLPQVTSEHQLAELSKLSGIPRASVYRLMSQLLEAGAVDLIGKRYVVGASMIDLARHAEPAQGLRQRALPFMNALRERTGTHVALIGQSGEGAIVLEVIPGRELLPVHIFAGRRLPQLAAASLVLGSADLPERVDPIHRTAIDDEHVVPGLHCFAVAVVLPDGSKAALQIATNQPLASPDVLRLTQEAGHRIGVALRQN